MGILDKYKKELQREKEAESEIGFDEELSEHDKEVKKLIASYSNDPNSMENVYQRKMSEMTRLTEVQMVEKNLIKEEPVKRTSFKRAFCDKCGTELVSKTPAMLNPFTFERICKHTCDKCGAVYNLDFAYPRVVFYDSNDNEIKLFTE